MTYVVFTSRSDSGHRWRTPWAPALAWRRGRVCTRSRCGSRPPPPPAARRCRSSGGSGSPHTARGMFIKWYLMLDFDFSNCLLFVRLRTKRQSNMLQPFYPQLDGSFEWYIVWQLIPITYMLIWSLVNPNKIFLHSVAEFWLSRYTKTDGWHKWY